MLMLQENDCQEPARVEKVSASEQAAALMMVGFEGTQPPAYLKELLEEGLSGVVLFSRNVRDDKQVRSMTESLQSLSARSRPDEDLLIAADQEGGPVVRFSDDSCWSPAAMALGASRDCRLTKSLARRTGCALRRRGVNMNLAPVLDVNTDPKNPVIGVRSYGSNPQLVSALGASTIRGLQDSNVAAVGKHFCGHGDTKADSHFHLPVVKRDLQQLKRVELVPFYQAVTAGVAAIMTAHVVFSAYDDRLPATLSGRVLQELLREELGFSGVIMTDCMEMGAIADNFPHPAAAVRAIEAGADLVLYSHSEKLQRRVHARLTEEIEAGNLPQERVRDSTRRVAALKKALRSGHTLQHEDCWLDCPAACRQTIGKAAARGVTVLCGEKEFPLPGCGLDTAALARGEHWQILLPSGADGPWDDLAERISRGCPRAELFRYADSQPPGRRPVGDVGKSLLVLTGPEGLPHLTDEQLRSLVVFSFSGPFPLMDLARRPQAAACTYDASPSSVSAALRCLFRGAAAPGRLPVAIKGWER